MVETIGFPVTANQSSAGDYLPIDSDTLAGCTVTNSSAYAVEYSTGGAWTTIAAGGSATINTGAIATTSLRFRKKTGDSIPVVLSVAVTHPGETPAQLATDGSINYLVDAQGKPIRQVIQVAQNFVPAVRQSVGDASDTNYVTLANIPVPGGLMGPNGQLRIFLFSQFTTTGTKYLAVDAGGVNISGPSYSAAQVNGGLLIYFNNVGATNQQKTANAGSNPFAASNNAIISSSVNTDVPFNIVARVKWSAAAGAAGADNFTLLGYTVEAVYAP